MKKMRQIFCVIMALSMLIVSGVSVEAHTSQAPIRINSNDDFSNVASSGNGTAENPWVIEELDINGSDYGYCIYIGNTTDYFTIGGCYLHEAYTTEPNPIYSANAGIVLYNVENGLIEENEIEYNGWFGIYVLDSDNNVLENNSVCQNGYGIFIFSNASYNTVQYNSVCNNSYAGIKIGLSKNNLIYRNTVDYNGIGIQVSLFASMNTVKDNLAFYNDCALMIEFSSYNTVLLNSFCLSHEYGVYVGGFSFGNKIYHNNFGNNAAQAHDSGFGTIWNADYPEGGNFWTDYAGVDNYSGINQDLPGSDEIGDTPYSDIDGGSSEDCYPLWGVIDTFGLGKREDLNGLGKREDLN